MVLNFYNQAFAVDSKQDTAAPVSMILKKTAVQQGQYFEVDITGAEKNPLVWFN